MYISLCSQFDSIISSSASKIIAIPNLSSAPKVVVPSVLIIFPSIIGLTPLHGLTWSICAQKVIGFSLLFPFKYATIFPAFPPNFSPALSTFTSNPLSFK